MTRAGANRKDGQGLTAVLVQKNTTTPAPDPQTPPENSEMSTAELAKAQADAVTALLTMDDVQKSHYLGLDGDAKVAFLAKSADERKTEAEAAKALADKAATEAEAVKSGKTAHEIDLEKRLSDQAKEIEALKSARADDEVAKRARTEFSGFPGGEEKAVELLKAFALLPEDARKSSEALMKSQCDIAKSYTFALGLSEDELAKAAPASAEVEKKAKELMMADDTIPSIEVAKGKVLTDPRNAELFARVAAEENAQRAALN